VNRFEFWHGGDVADIITHANFMLSGLGVSEFWQPQFCHSTQA